MPRVRVIAGTARSDRAARIDALLAHSPDRSLLIVPTQHHAQLRTEVLLRTSGRAAIFDPPVVTFDGLVRRVLRGTPLEHASIEPLRQHLLLRHVVERVAANGSLDAIGTAARTEGFLDHLQSVISQLKQAAIEPDDFLQRLRNAKRKNAMDGVVAAVYAAYQDELRRSNAVDLQGMYWLARNICEDACPAALQPVEHLLLDEFDDFTPSEFRVIHEAARHVGELTFGLNVDLGPAQADLYAIPRATLDRIRQVFGETQVDPLEEPAALRATDFIGSSLLVRDAIERPESLAMNLEFIECHTVDHEIETVARHIKRQIRERDVSPGDIALVLRRPSDLAETIADVFAEFGIPVSVVAEIPLARTPLGGFVLHLLDAIQTWRESEVTDVLVSPWFTGPASPHANTFHTLARAARPRASRNGWERSAEFLAERIAAPTGEETVQLLKHVPHAAAACAAFQTMVGRLIKSADLLSTPATVAEFALALDRILQELPINATIHAMTDPRVRAREAAARDAFSKSLAQLYDSGTAYGYGELALAEFARVLRRALTLLGVRAESAIAPAVACLDMASARYLSYEHVYLIGMTDDAVPARPPVSALYAEDERAELRALGVPLDDALKHNRREVLMFQRMFSIARGSLTIAWHRIMRGGQATQRSLFVEEVADRLPDVRIHRPLSVRSVATPEADLVACERDARNYVFANGATGSAAGEFPDMRAAAEIELARHDFEPCGVHDAVLARRENLDWLRLNNGPESEFSATALETYAQCPFAYFRDRVLRLFRVEPTEALLDARIRGGVLHRALEKFHSEFAGRAVADIDPRDAAPAMERALDAEFTKARKSYSHIARGLLDAQRAHLSGALSRYLAIAYARDDPRWKPTAFEVPFGRARGDRERYAPAYALDLGEETVRLTGCIDRIDRDGDAIRVIDYKTSKVAKIEIDEKRNFQLALYALAVESGICSAGRCESASYVAVGKNAGETIALSRDGDSPNWDKRIELARAAVLDAVRGIRTGVFHPTLRAEACRGCASEKACRYERGRMRRKGGA